jgi:hypothetical protein
VCIYIFIYLYSYLFSFFYLKHFLISIEHNNNLPFSGHRRIWILQSVKQWQKMQHLRMNLNAELPWQKQHSTDGCLISNVELNVMKKLVKCYIWIIAVYGAETLTVLEVDWKYLDRFEMRCCRNIDVMRWTDRFKNEVLQRISENKNILHTMKQNRPKWTGTNSRHSNNKIHKILQCYNFTLNISIRFDPQGTIISYE